MWTDDIKQALINLDGFGHYTAIYTEIEKCRNNLSKDWHAVLRRTIQQHSSDSQSWLGKRDLFYSVDGIGRGVWGLREFFPSNYTTYKQENILKEPCNRRQYFVNRVVRDTAISAQLKEYHKNICQICGLRLEIGDKKYYSEGHHIKPLGKPHNGPDSANNIIIVCPNCHVLCDNFQFKLDLISLEASTGRKIEENYINYHNERCLNI